MDAIRQATDSELKGNVHITADGRCKASGFWCPTGGSTGQLRGEWLLEHALPTDENITYMAMEVERRVLGGAQDFEITLYPPAFRPDPVEDARRIGAALVAAAAGSSVSRRASTAPASIATPLPGYRREARRLRLRTSSRAFSDALRV